MTAPDLRIAIGYKTSESDAWVSVVLSPEEYFDIEPDEVVGLNSVPKHNHGIDYLALDRLSVTTTKITLTDLRSGSSRVMQESFWNNGQNRVIERTDSGDDEYWEMILDTHPDGSPLQREILRLVRRDGVVTPIYHGFFRQNQDGSKSETKIELKS